MIGLLIVGGDTEGKGAFLFEKREEEHKRGECEKEDDDRRDEEEIVIGREIRNR